MTNAHGSPPISPRKRRRPPLSCEQCRQRKVRCDRKEPCGPCTRARKALACSYTDDYASYSDLSELGTGAIDPVAPSTRDLPEAQSSLSRDSHEHGNHASFVPSRVTELQAIRDLQERLQHVERTLDSFKQTSQPKAPFSPSTEVHAFQQVQHRLQGIEQRLSELGHQNSQAFKLTSDRLPSNQTIDSHIPAIIPRLRTTSDKSKLFSSNHWLHTAEKFQAIGKFDTKDLEISLDDEHANWTTTMRELRSLRRSVQRQELPRLNDPVPDLLSTIPPREVCDELVDHYINTFEVIYRVIHVPSFRQEYEEFWTQTQSTPSRFMMKLVLILAIGTTFSAENFKGHRRSAQSWIYAAQWWLAGPSEKNVLSLDGLQVYCLLLIARQTNSHGESSAISAPSLLRIAMAMGLHRSAKLFPALTVFEAEMRARLWKTIVELYVQSCLDSGTPLLLDVSDFDSCGPSDIDDSEISPQHELTPVEKSGSVYTDSSVSILLSKSLRSRIAAVKQLNGIGQASYEQTLRLGNEIRSACRDIATFFNSWSTSQPSVLEPTNFHRDFLDMYFRWHIVCLHRPFMLRAREDPRFYLSRKICLESSTIIASYASHLQLPHHAPSNLDRLMMHGSGWLKGPLSLDVITTLGLEIITQLEEERKPSHTDQVSAIDPLDAMADAARALLVQSLEHILEQSLQIIALGVPRLKRYNFLAAILGQIRAMQSGQPVKRAVYDAIVEAMKQSHDTLQASQTIPLPDHGTAPNGTDYFDSGSADLFDDIDFGNLDPNMTVDFPALFLFPGFSSGVGGV